MSRALDRKALRDIVRRFKPEGVSDFDAALNVVERHAATIRKLQDQQDRLLDALRGEIAVLQGLVEEVVEEGEDLITYSEEES